MKKTSDEYTALLLAQVEPLRASNKELVEALETVEAALCHNCKAQKITNCECELKNKVSAALKKVGEG